VVFVVDAMTDRDPDAHRYSIEKMFPRLGETETTDNGPARFITYAGRAIEDPDGV
jgi:hypothetical protein